ncbi:MAG: acid phosphatase [Mycobacteriaceae bacterium]
MNIKLSRRAGFRSLIPVTVLALVPALAAGTVVAPAQAQVQPPEIVGEYLPATLPPVQHDGAPAPRPFGPQEYNWYLSDLSSYQGGIYYGVVSGFEDLRANHPGVMDQNLDTVVEVNNTADPQTVGRAQVDAAADDADLLTALSDAFGETLGDELRTALAENRLPKTRMLLDSGYLSRAGGVASSTLIEKEIFDYARPFEAAPDRITKHTGGGNEDLYELGNASFPSGHTNQATWTTTLLAVLLPELAPQLIARGSEAGYNRMVMGVHYPLDVIGGRMTGQAAAGDRWNDPRMRSVLTQAGDEIRKELEWRTGTPLDEAIAGDSPYRSTEAAVAEYTERMTYSFDTVGDPDARLTVPQGAPELLSTAFPDLDWGQRARVLAATALPAGYPLDDQSAAGREAGNWQRINLAAAFAADVTVGDGGMLTVNGSPA